MKRNPSASLIGAMLAALAVIAVAALIAWFRIDGNGDDAKPALASTVKIGGHFELTDHTGRRVTDADYRGKFLLIYFGYAYCPDVCPTELATMADTLDKLGDKAKAVQPLFITVDPARDTVDFLADYVSNFHPRLIGLTGSAEDIAAVAKAYRVFYSKVGDPKATDYLVDHSSFVYLMGPDGDFLTMFRYGTSAEDMAKAIGTHLKAAG